MGIEKTSGAFAATPTMETAEPSGAHRSCGRGTVGVKMCTDSPSLRGAPPLDGTTKSAASCSFFATDGVDTT